MNIVTSNTSLSRGEIMVLFFLLCIGFWLRFSGISFGLPYIYHADEPVVVNHALNYGTGDFNPHFFRIPPLVSYCLFLIYGFYFLLGFLTGKFHQIQDFETLFFQDPSSFYFLGRLLLGVIPGTLTLLCFYHFLRRRFSAIHALIGTTLLTFCFLHARDSHYIYTDILLILVLILAINFFFQLGKNSSDIEHFWAGALIGLAAAVKYNGVFIVLVYLVMTFHKSSVCLRQWLLAGLTSIITFCFLNPFMFANWNFFIQELQNEATAHSSIPFFHHINHSLSGALGWGLLSLCFAGLVHGGLLRERKRIGLFIFICVYYLIISIEGQAYDRYVLPLLPFLLFFAADFLIFLMAQLGRIGGAVGIGLLSICLFQPVFSILLFNQIMSAKDTRTVAREWIEANLPSGSKIALDGTFYSPRLSFSPAQLEEKINAIKQDNDVLMDSRVRRLESLLKQSQGNIHYELFFLAEKTTSNANFVLASPAIPYSLAELAKNNVQYVIIVSHRPEDALNPFYQELAREGKLLHTINPYRNKKIVYMIDPQPLTGGPFLLTDLILRECNGPPITIYQLS